MGIPNGDKRLGRGSPSKKKLETITFWIHNPLHELELETFNPR